MTITIAEVLEQAARDVECASHSREHAAARIRALAAQYEGYRVIEPDDVIYKRIADKYKREAVAAEREAIADEFAMRLQADLENGVSCLNERASSEFARKYPEIAGFMEWLNTRGES